jgi:hypothetical protein
MSTTLMIHAYEQKDAYDCAFGFLIVYPNGDTEEIEYGKLPRLFREYSDDDNDEVVFIPSNGKVKMDGHGCYYIEKTKKGEGYTFYECRQEPDGLQREIVFQRIINILEDQGYFAPINQVALFMKDKIPSLIMQKKNK